MKTLKSWGSNNDGIWYLAEDHIQICNCKTLKQVSSYLDNVMFPLSEDESLTIEYKNGDIIYYKDIDSSNKPVLTHAINIIYDNAVGYMYYSRNKTLTYYYDDDDDDESVLRIGTLDDVTTVGGYIPMIDDDDNNNDDNDNDNNDDDNNNDDKIKLAAKQSYNGKLSSFQSMCLKFKYKYHTYNDDDKVKLLYNFGDFVANSVINKCIDPQGKQAYKAHKVSDNGQNNSLISIRNEIYFDRLEREREYQINSTYGDGIDLSHIAITTLLKLMGKYNTSDLQKVIDITYQSRRVYIQGYHYKKTYKTVKSTLLQYCFKRVRQYIIHESPVKYDISDKHTYIDDIDDRGNTIYLQARPYNDIMTGVSVDTDISTTDYNMFRRFYALLDDFEQDVREDIQQNKEDTITERQAEILDYRLQGFGNKAIGTYLNISDVAVLKIRKRIEDNFRKWNDKRDKPIDIDQTLQRLKDLHIIK